MNFIRKFKSIEKGQLLVLGFVEAQNKRKQNVMGRISSFLPYRDPKDSSGFIDIKDRCRGSKLAPFDLTRDWLTPTKDDITFFNFATNVARSNSTLVSMIKNLSYTEILLLAS